MVCLGHLFTYLRRNPVYGARLVAKGIVADPYMPLGWTLSAGTLAYEGRVEEALDCLCEAAWHCPLDDPASFHHAAFRGLALYAAGDYRQALLWLRLSLARQPEYTSNYKGIAACYATLGNERTARATSRQLRRREPMFAMLGNTSTPFGSARMEKLYRKHLSAAGMFDPAL